MNKISILTIVLSNIVIWYGINQATEPILYVLYYMMTAFFTALFLSEAKKNIEDDIGGDYLVM